MAIDLQAAATFIPNAMRWISNQSRQVAFGVPPKNGMHSFWEVLRGDDVHFHVNPYKCHRRVFIIRHPIERFKSLWKNKCRDGEDEALGVIGLTLEELYEHTINHKDYHWMPQVELLDGVDAEIVKLENIGAWWRENMGGEFPKLHETNGDIEISPELLSKLRVRYLDDLRMWHGI